jgi:hypothetical protein
MGHPPEKLPPPIFMVVVEFQELFNRIAVAAGLPVHIFGSFHKIWRVPYF